MKYMIIILIGLGGCASNKQEEHDLLHRDELIAYKSITIKDIIGEKEFN